MFIGGNKKMAKTSEGYKKVYVHSYTTKNGNDVKTHYRSTPNTSKPSK